MRAPRSRTAGNPMNRAVVRPLLIAALVLALLGPFVPMLLWAISRTWRYPALWPQGTGDRALKVIADPGSAVLSGLLTSAGIALAVAVISAAIALAAGRALALHDVPGVALVRFALLAPVIVPGIAVGLGIQVAFTRIGLADGVPGVVVAHLIPTVPYATVVLAAAYSRFDVRLEQQARLLGTPAARVLLHVTLPALRPALTVTMLLTFLISWNEYLLTLLVGGGLVATAPLLLFAAIGSGDSAVASALALMIALPPLAVVGLTTRALAGGDGFTAVGGARG